VEVEGQDRPALVAENIGLRTRGTWAIRLRALALYHPRTLTHHRPPALISGRRKCMDPTHRALAGLIVTAIAIPVVGSLLMARILRKDEAIDAATFLALRDLRERFDRTK
jgi:hypothetical protein